jgi:transcriptional regulator with XRE-family HTH domain
VKDLCIVRHELKLTDVSALTGINIALLSQIERGLRVPTPRQRALLANLFGPNVKFSEGGYENMSVPEMPEIKWKKDGTPDFTHLDRDDGTVKDQLETLIVEDNGDGASLKHLTTEHCYFEVLDEDAGRTIYRQSYLVTNGKASLRGDAVEAQEEFEVLSRRRVPKAGVPEMTTGQDQT